MATEPSTSEPPPEGLRLVGVVRNAGRSLPLRGGVGADPERIAFRDIAALVRPGPFALPEIEREAVLAHHHDLDNAMRRGTVLPAPFGIVFRDRAGVLAFLEQQHLSLENALVFADFRWEMRLHMRRADVGTDNVATTETTREELRETAGRLFGELRQGCRAATSLAADGASLLSTAFLVDRAETRRFVARAEELGQLYPELALDLTGPWPPYDFVQIRAEPDVL